jgi:putative intracellular protease/amidase
MTATSYWTLKDGTRHPTGYWAEEFAAPYSALTAAGHHIVVSTPGGVVPYVDVCHAPVAMLATRRAGVSPFAGYRVTAYTNDEEDAVGLRVKAPWTAEDQLVKLGVDFLRGEMWQPFTVVDRNLYTGQNPASAAPLAQELLKVLR